MKMEAVVDTKKAVDVYEGMYDFEKPDNCWRRANTVSALDKDVSRMDNEM